MLQLSGGSPQARLIGSVQSKHAMMRDERPKCEQSIHVGRQMLVSNGNVRFEMVNGIVNKIVMIPIRIRLIFFTYLFVSISESLDFFCMCDV